MDSSGIKQHARSMGADLVGIAPIDRFEGQSPDRDPSEIFPEARSVIVLGRRLLRGSMRGVEEGTNFASTYNTFGLDWLENQFLAQTCYDLTCEIEEHGFEAVPIFGYGEAGMPKGRPVAAGKPAPNIYIDIPYAAQAAGLGEIGLGGFFITPQFGTRQRLCLILTDLELEPDPVSEKHICSDCGACAEACPFGAIDVEHCTEQGVPGHGMQVATVDYTKCGSCPNGAITPPGRGCEPDRLAALCGRACLVRLEESGKLGNRFENRFRKRETWALDAFGNAMSGSKYQSPITTGCDGAGSQG